MKAKLSTSGIVAMAVTTCVLMFCLGVWWAGGRILPRIPKKESPNLAQQMQYAAEKYQAELKAKSK